MFSFERAARFTACGAPLNDTIKMPRVRLFTALLGFARTRFDRDRVKILKARTASSLLLGHVPSAYIFEEEQKGRCLRIFWVVADLRLINLVAVGELSGGGGARRRASRYAGEYIYTHRRSLPARKTRNKLICDVCLCRAR